MERYVMGYLGMMLMVPLLMTRPSLDDDWYDVPWFSVCWAMVMRQVQLLGPMLRAPEYSCMGPSVVSARPLAGRISCRPYMFFCCAVMMRRYVLTTRRAARPVAACR